MSTGHNFSIQAVMLAVMALSACAPGGRPAGNVGQHPDRDKKELVALGRGTGIFVSAQGLMVTVAHVIKSCQSVRVMNSRGEEYAAQIVMRDDSRDIALLRVDVKAPAWAYILKRKLQKGESTRLVGVKGFHKRALRNYKGLQNHKSIEPFIATIDAYVAGFSSKNHTEGGELLWKDFDLYSYDEIVRGFSGGAVLDKNNFLIGFVRGANKLLENEIVAVRSGALGEYFSMVEKEGGQLAGAGEKRMASNSKAGDIACPRAAM